MGRAGAAAARRVARWLSHDWRLEKIRLCGSPVPRRRAWLLASGWRALQQGRAHSSRMSRSLGIQPREG